MRRKKRIKALALAFAVAGTIASAAQAVPVPGVYGNAGTASVAQRPDDRAGPLGVGTQPALIDRSDVVSRYLDRQAGTVAYQHSLGIGTMPDSALRPDDRPGILGVGEVEPVTTPTGTGFDWEDAGVGLGSGFAIALALGGAFLLMRRYAGGHRPGTAAAR
jgi:hypothetical protein